VKNTDDRKKRCDSLIPLKNGSFGILNAIVKVTEKELILMDVRTEEMTKFLNVRKLSNAGKLEKIHPILF
jgi:hypothetical protein